MTLPYPIAASQVDKKSPVDEQLMQAIKGDLDFLDTQRVALKTFELKIAVEGYLNVFYGLVKRRVGAIEIMRDYTLSTARLSLEEPGTSGSVEVDVRKVTTPNTPIQALTRQKTGAINSIARTGSAINTQSITRSTAQIATQSITQWKSSLNIQSVIPLGNNLVRYNFSAPPDSDYLVGDYADFTGCSDSNNNGSFPIVKINEDGDYNLIVTNALGVEQSSASGTGVLAAWSYNYSNPVSTEFSDGELSTFAAHTDPANNGQFAVYKINQSGNNIIVKNQNGVAQGGIAGNANANRWKYTFVSSAPSDYAVGEKAFMSGHTSGANDGNFIITGVNQGGNNIVVYNSSGVTQGGAAGTVQTNRWTYFLTVDPSSGISAGDEVVAVSTTSSANSGRFTAKQVNRSTSDNVVVYNESGVAQGGAVGTLSSSKMLVKFSADFSSIYTTASRVEVTGTKDTDGYYDVVQVNRGGGANYNVVISAPNGTEQVGAAGRIFAESKSIFSTRPKLTPASNTNRHIQVDTAAVFNSNAIMTLGDILEMDVLSVPSGNPRTLTLQLY